MKNAGGTTKFFQNFILILGAVILGITLYKSIIKADTVWELADEAGYLSNTAYFLGVNWDEVRATMPYYAYGYSVFLIPIFLLSATGVHLIRGAMFVNLFFALGTYIILIYLLEHAGHQTNRILTSLISFVVCLNSYLCCNVLKVDCEPLSVFWYCLTALVLYKSLECGKKHWFVILGVVTSYLFFIHTRMFVAIIAVFFALLITSYVYGKKKYVRHFVIFGITFFICFLLFYMIKNSIIKYAAGLEQISNVTQGNLVNENYVLDRIKWLFSRENVRGYLLTFFSKIFYIIIVSGGTIFFGYTRLWADLASSTKLTSKENMSSYAVKLFFLSGMTFMIVISTISGASLEDFRIVFYSRYYENMVIPIIAFGILDIVTPTKKTGKHYFIIAAVQVMIGMIISDLRHYLSSNEIRLDTARVPGFSWMVKNADSFYSMVLFSILISVLLVGIYFVSEKLGKIKPIIVLLSVVIVTWNSTSLGIQYIDNVHINGKPDVELAAYILNAESGEAVYMIDDESYKINRIYSRMQVLLKDIPLKIIYKDELERIDTIPDGSWVLTYTDTPMRDTYSSSFQNVMEGDVFELWKK